MKFKIGDIVRATPESNSVYAITNYAIGFYGKVCDVSESSITVQGYSPVYNTIVDTYEYEVNPKYFELYTCGHSLLDMVYRQKTEKENV